MSKPIFSPWLEDIIYEAENKETMINEINTPTPIFLTALAALRDQHITDGRYDLDNIIQYIIVTIHIIQQKRNDLETLSKKNVGDDVMAGVRQMIRNNESSLNALYSSYIAKTRIDV